MHPLPPRPPNERWERAPHEEVMELVERKFDELNRRLDAIEARLR